MLNLKEINLKRNMMKCLNQYQGSMQEQKNQNNTNCIYQINLRAMETEEIFHIQ